jgi:glycosyltransferase involved in cell wall biosynthesis
MAPREIGVHNRTAVKQCGDCVARLKILWISHLVPFPPKGGVLQRSFNLLREVSRYHEVHLAAFVQHDLVRMHFESIEAGLRASEQALAKFCASIRVVSVPCDLVRYGKSELALKSLLGDPYTIRWLRSVEMSQVLRQCAGSASFDLVHYDTISLAPYREVFASTPSVLDHHNVESHMMQRRADGELNLLKKLYFKQESVRLRAYERRHLRSFNLHITCSALDSDRLREIDPGLRVSEIENGADLEYFSPRQSTREAANTQGLRLVFAGRLSAYANRQAVLAIATDIWPVISQRYPSLSIDIVGSLPPPQLLELAARDSRFRVHGYVDDVRPYLDAADVYICPITDGGGTKLKVIDALAMGKALVAHPIACEGIDVSEGLNVLYAVSPEDYVAKIGALIESPERRAQLGAQGRALVERQYSYASIGRKLASLFESTAECARQSIWDRKS